MSQIKAYIHYVWATKHRQPFLECFHVRKALWQHILEYGRDKEIHIDFVNGYHDHCHCLVSLNGNQTIADIARLIKGESSYWINKQKLIKDKFAWQKEFYASSVSESHLDKIREYIKNQERHHSSIIKKQD